MGRLMVKVVSKMNHRYTVTFYQYGSAAEVTFRSYRTRNGPDQSRGRPI